MPRYVALGLSLIPALLLCADTSPVSEPRLLDLNVIALDSRGQPVNDLTAEDFQIADAGKPQKLALFRHNVSQTDPHAPLGKNEFTNRMPGEPRFASVILFDLLNEGFSTRNVAANQIVKALEPLESSDSLFLYILAVDGHLVPVHGLPGFAAEPTRPEPPSDVGPPGVAPSRVTWTRQIKPILDEAMRVVTRIRSPDIDVANRVLLTYQALDALAVELSAIPGRKNIVWVTDGVPIGLGERRSDVAEMVDFTPQLRRLSDSLDRAGIAIYPVRQVLLGSADEIGATSGGNGATGGAGIGIQSIATLNEFANATGGRPNTDKDIAGALRQAMNDLRSSYQIGYYPPDKSWDGKFHKLKVTCKRKGVRIQAKTGYYAWADPPGTRARLAMADTAATAFDAGEIGLRARVTPGTRNGQAAQVDIRIDARDVAFAQEGDQFTGQLRIQFIGYFADGKLGSIPVAPLDMRFTAAQRDQTLKDGINFTKNIIPTGQEVKYRVIVFDRGSNTVGSVTIPAEALAAKP